TIVLRSGVVSRNHGEVRHVGNAWIYTDVGSTNGTYVNGRKINSSYGESESVMLSDGDLLRIDGPNLSNPDSRGVVMLFMTDCPQNVRWKFHQLQPNKTLMIGRDPSVCSILLSSMHVSAVHAAIAYRNGNYYLDDCGSSNGTWVGNQRITGEYMLSEKSSFALCDTRFIFTGGYLIYPVRMNTEVRSVVRGSEPYPMPQHRADNVMLRAHIKSKQVSNKNGHGYIELLHDVKVELKEASLVALLGGSGAGKTTLMNCLNGSKRDGVTGDVSFNNEDLYANYERLKHMIGNVPQQNVVHPDLRVDRELYYAANIRLPSDIRPKELHARVDKTIKLLGLEHCRKSPIRTLSGGELKRVNIGIELVANRNLLCLDEPDAGLDPETKASLTKLLADLSHNEKKTIIVIIHDVANIDLFDQVIFMTKMDNCGRLAFQGSPEDARKYFGVSSLEQAYDVLSKDPSKYVK
ncbi:MAG: FHA domain-containing protein, partial [Clostridia bacterium]|nr:FHA domain-containing protein [Clostridia bacterium]